VGHRRLNLIGTVGGVGLRTVGSKRSAWSMAPVRAPSVHLTGMVGDVGVAAATVHHDDRGWRLAVAKSLLNGSRAALPA
jgi:hypothetical protein